MSAHVYAYDYAYDYVAFILTSTLQSKRICTFNKRQTAMSCLISPRVAKSAPQHNVVRACSALMTFFSPYLSFAFFFFFLCSFFLFVFFLVVLCFLLFVLLFFFFFLFDDTLQRKHQVHLVLATRCKSSKHSFRTKICVFHVRDQPSDVDGAGDPPFGGASARWKSTSLRLDCFLHCRSLCVESGKAKACIR